MKDRKTGQPRGFGFVTYADPSVVDQVIQDTHIINGKQVGFAVVLMLDLTAEKPSLSFYFLKIQ